MCDILVRGLATVGIIALVDEATGFKYDTARDALQEILRQFISEELVRWASTFPDDFYRELFRLRDLEYSELSSKRPQYMGHLTNDIVYERLAPHVLEELKQLIPKTETGRRKYRYYWRLSRQVGHPKLREHLSNLVTLMKASSSWKGFYRLLERAKPKYKDLLTRQQLALAMGNLDGEIEDDDF
jgi:hypothetical protein